MNFTAIDFETATGYRNSICQVGIVRIEDNKIASEQSYLVKPPNNFYWYSHINIHGIDSKKTERAPRFDAVWHIIKPLIENELVVAHNIGFDLSCLKSTLELYELEIPNFDKDCTLKLYKKGLKKICEELGIQLNHHDALSDARACGQLYLNYQNQQNS